MNVVQAKASDLNSLIPLFEGYRKFYDQGSDAAAVEEFLGNRISNNESKIFIALSEDGSKAMGFVQLYPLFSSVSMKKLWLLNDLFVSPNYRKQGIAESLMNTAQEIGLVKNH